MSSSRVLAPRQPAQAQASSKKNQAQHPALLKPIENRSAWPNYSLATLHIFSPDGVRRGETQGGPSTLPFPTRRSWKQRSLFPRGLCT